MSDATRRDGDKHSRDNDATSSEWLPAKEAAARLGISVRTVQRQAQAGRITSRIEGERLFILLDATDDIPRHPDATTTERVATVSPNDATGDAAALVEQLKSENEFLRETVRAGEQAQSELRRLMMADKQELLELRQRLAIVARSDAQADAGTAEAIEAVKETGAMEKPVETDRQGQKRSRWQFWRR